MGWLGENAQAKILLGWEIIGRRKSGGPEHGPARSLLDRPPVGAGWPPLLVLADVLLPFLTSEVAADAVGAQLFENFARGRVNDLGGAILAPERSEGWCQTNLA